MPSKKMLLLDDKRRNGQSKGEKKGGGIKTGHRKTGHRAGTRVKKYVKNNQILQGGRGESRLGAGGQGKGGGGGGGHVRGVGRRF